jgi:hypothetical protein
MNLDAILIQVKEIIGIAKTLRKIWPTWRCYSKNRFPSFSQLADTPVHEKDISYRRRRRAKSTY